VASRTINVRERKPWLSFGRIGDKMEIAGKIQEIAGKVRAQKPGIETEEGTKNAFVMPFIGTVLGYDVFNPSEVIPEFTADVGIKKGEKIDYALVCNGEVQVLVEVKKSHRASGRALRIPAIPLLRGHQRAGRDPY
jgi:hypothetical protein